MSSLPTRSRALTGAREKPCGRALSPSKNWQTSVRRFGRSSDNKSTYEKRPSQSLLVYYSFNHSHRSVFDVGQNLQIFGVSGIVSASQFLRLSLAISHSRFQPIYPCNE